MHIGNRIFPYPILNRNGTLSDYVATSTFELKFEVDKNKAPIVKNGEVVFKNLHFTLTDDTLTKLLKQGKLQGAFIVECSDSVYRNRFDISTTPYDLPVSAHEINGNVVASCYLYAAEDIPNFCSRGFIADYAGYSFDIDKFDILAVDDGVNFKIELDPTKDDKVASIFTIAKREDSGDIMSYVCNDKKIIIHLPSTYYDCYAHIKTKWACNNIAFAMLAIPVLSSCLDEISKYESMEDILEHHSWFNAVCISYMRKTRTKLTFDDFRDKNKLELAQMVMNSASCNGLKDFANMLLSGINTMDEEGDENEQN